MRLIEGPNAPLPYPPKACVVTNRTDGDVVDLNTVIDRPGPTRLYLRRTVVEEAAKLCGMVPAAEVEELRERVKALADDLGEARKTQALTNQLEDQINKERIPA